MTKKVFIIGCFFSVIFPTNLAVEVFITSNVSGLEGSNGTEITCTFTRKHLDNFFQLSITANSSGIVNVQSSGAQLTSFGKYLDGRVHLRDLQYTFTNTSHVTSTAGITFTNLLCIDNNTYQCILNYGDSLNNGYPVITRSNPASVIVRVFPSKPQSITVLRDDKEFDNTFTGASGNRFALGEYIDGEIVKIVCKGQVGNPPAEILKLQKIRDDKSIVNLTVIYEPVLEEIANCSYYQKTVSTIKLTADDSNARFRCHVSFFHNENHMSIETFPIIVRFPVRNATILKDDWEITNTTLFCIGTGNPPPAYTWYRTSDGTDSIPWTFQNITINKGGLYRCVVSNAIGGVVYVQSANISLPMTADYTSNPGNCNYIGYVIGLVFLGVLLIVTISIIIYLCRT